jgi:DNA-binding NarL/FixJ family response regulator
MPVRVVVADDNPVIRLGVRAALSENAAIRVVGEAVDGRGMVDLVRSVPADVILLDLQVPDEDGLSAVAELARYARVVVLTSAHEPDAVARSIERGATGYLVHGAYDVRQLVDAVLAAARGRPFVSPAATTALVQAIRRHGPLTPDRAATAAGALSARERDVMRLVAEGMSNHEIGLRLGLSEKTIKNHLQNIYPKLGVHSRAAALGTWLGAGAAAGPTADRRHG